MEICVNLQAWRLLQLEFVFSHLSEGNPRSRVFFPGPGVMPPRRRFLGETSHDAADNRGNFQLLCKCEGYGENNMLPRRDQFRWTVLVSEHVEGGRYREALGMYKKMREEGVEASTYTFVHALKACSCLGDLETGKEIHAHAMEQGDGLQLFVATMVLGMYAKCGSLAEAVRIFDELPRRDVVSWNTMILGYAKMEEGELALQLYAQMQLEGVVPDDRTFVGALKACGSLAALEEGTEVQGEVVKLRCIEKGRAIHLRAMLSGVASDVFVANTLMDMYVKCGSMVEAVRVFDKLPHRRDVVSWNVMILGCAKMEEPELALQFYAQMQLEGAKPNDRTFVSSIKACSSLAGLEVDDGEPVKMLCLEKGRSIHSQVVKSGFQSDAYVGNTLIDMYVKCGSIADANDVFWKLPRRDVVSWNTMILGYAEDEDGDMALQMYAWMQQEGISPDGRTFVGVVKACSKRAKLEEGTEVDGQVVKTECLGKGRAIHSRVVEDGFESDEFVGTTLVDMYVTCGSMLDARHVFDRLPCRDVVSWNVMIMGYAELGETEDVFKLYADMQEQGVSSDSVTFVGILKACGKTAALEVGKQLHDRIRSVGLEMADMMVANAVIDMYGKCGSMCDAQQVFDRLPNRDVVSWNALISGYGRQGEARLVFQLFTRMRQQGIRPNGVTFLSVLTACSHAGLVDEGLECFDAMSNDYDTIPVTIEHYNAIVDIFGRSGQLEEALAMVEEMPFEPNLVTWMTILGACRQWGDEEIGRNAFEHAMKLDKKHGAAYALLANIYSDAHKWEDRDKVQAARGNAQAWKKAGQSWGINVDGVMHTFVVGDKKHAHRDVIYSKLKNLSDKIMEGRVDRDL